MDDAELAVVAAENARLRATLAEASADCLRVMELNARLQLRALNAEVGLMKLERAVRALPAPACTCGMGDGTQPVLHSAQCALRQPCPFCGCATLGVHSIRCVRYLHTSELRAWQTAAACTCGEGDGSLPELHAPRCAMRQPKNKKRVNESLC